MANLRKEIDRIQAKEGKADGLTEGQAAAIVRNEQVGRILHLGYLDKSLTLVTVCDLALCTVPESTICKCYQHGFQFYSFPIR